MKVIFNRFLTLSDTLKARSRRAKTTVKAAGRHGEAKRGFSELKNCKRLLKEAHDSIR